MNLPRQKLLVERVSILPPEQSPGTDGGVQVFPGEVSFDGVQGISAPRGGCHSASFRPLSCSLPIRACEHGQRTQPCRDAGEKGTCSCCDECSVAGGFRKMESFAFLPCSGKGYRAHPVQHIASFTPGLREGRCPGSWASAGPLSGDFAVSVRFQYCCSLP